MLCVAFILSTWLRLGYGVSFLSVARFLGSAKFSAGLEVRLKCKASADAIEKTEKTTVSQKGKYELLSLWTSSLGGMPKASSFSVRRGMYSLLMVSLVYGPQLAREIVKQCY